jgi:nitrogen fixation protein
MTTTTHTDAAAPRAFKIPDLTPRPGRPPRKPAPSFRLVTADGAPCYAVGLSGKLGNGWEALVDAETWEKLRNVAGERWQLVGPDVPRSYVVTSTVAARKAAGTTSNVVMVARAIAGLQGHELGGMSVTYRNGLRLDLRAENLRVLPAASAGTYRAEGPLPVVVDGWQ